MEMNEQSRAKEIDKLVADYLEAAAEGVDAKGLLDRARQSRRVKRLRRQVGVISAIAAALIVGVIGFVFAKAPQANRLPVSRVPTVAQTIRQQAEQARGGARALLIGLDESVNSATGEILETVSPDSAPDFSGVVSEAKESLGADVRYVKSKAGSIVSGSLRKAGLLI